MHVQVKHQVQHKVRWDEAVVLSVLMGGIIALLILLASFMTVSGKASAAPPTFEGVLSVFSTAEVVPRASGEATCTIACLHQGKNCLLGRDGEQLLSCRSEESRSCLCGSVT